MARDAVIAVSVQGFLVLPTIVEQTDAITTIPLPMVLRSMMRDMKFFANSR